MLPFNFYRRPGGSPYVGMQDPKLKIDYTKVEIGGLYKFTIFGNSWFMIVTSADDVQIKGWLGGSIQLAEKARLDGYEGSVLTYPVDSWELVQPTAAVPTDYFWE